MPKPNTDRQAAGLLRQCGCSKIDVKFNDGIDLWFCFIWREARYYGIIRHDIVQVILEDRYRSSGNRFFKLRDRLCKSADLTEKIQVPESAAAASDLFRTAEDLIREQEELLEEARTLVAKLREKYDERNPG